MNRQKIHFVTLRKAIRPSTENMPLRQQLPEPRPVAGARRSTAKNNRSVYLTQSSSQALRTTRIGGERDAAGARICHSQARKPSSDCDG